MEGLVESNYELNDFNELVEDYVNICGYSLKDAMKAATQTLNQDLQDSDYNLEK